MKKEQKSKVEVDAQGNTYTTDASGTMTVVTAEQVRAEHVRTVADFGAAIVLAHIKTSDIYYKMCLYIRTEKVSEDAVRDALEPLDFIKQRITEINRVANASDALWSEFEARRLSFRRTLELSRGTVQLLLENQRPELTAQFPEEGAESEKSQEGKEQEKDAPYYLNLDREAMEAAAMKLCKLGEKLGVRAKTYQAENGWSVKVWRLSKERSRGPRPTAKGE